MKIAVLDGQVLNPGDLSWDSLEALGEVVHIDSTKAPSCADKAALAAGATALLTVRTPVTRELMEAFGTLRYIGLIAAGRDFVDLDAAEERGITVVAARDYGTYSVAQMVFALLLEICHHVAQRSDDVRRSGWERAAAYWNYQHPLMELADKTFGIIGYGRIGAQVGRIATALGMRVIAHDSFPFEEGVTYVSFEKLLADSDVLSLHCPLYPETRRLITWDTITMMKPGAILINTSRQELLDEEAVAEALESGKLYAAGLDIMVPPPFGDDNLLLRAPNCLTTPHIGWATQENRWRSLEAAAEELAAFISQES